MTTKAYLSTSTSEGDEERYARACALYRENRFVDAATILTELVNEGELNALPLLSILHRYDSGGIRSDPHKAFELAMQAVERVRHPEGLVAVAAHYFAGFGVKQDYALAMRFYLAAFNEYDHPVAALGLGRIHEYGHVGTADLACAKHYYLLAQQGGLSAAYRRYASCLFKEGRYAVSIAYHAYATLMSAILYGRRGAPAARQW